MKLRKHQGTKNIVQRQCKSLLICTIVFQVILEEGYLQYSGTVLGNQEGQYNVNSVDWIGIKNCIINNSLQKMCNFVLIPINDKKVPRSYKLLVTLQIQIEVFFYVAFSIIFIQKEQNSIKSHLCQILSTAFFHIYYKVKNF